MRRVNKNYDEKTQSVDERQMHAANANQQWRGHRHDSRIAFSAANESDAHTPDALRMTLAHATSRACDRVIQSL
jgi:hypothetical protein